MSMFESAAIGNPAYTETLASEPASAQFARSLVASALQVWELEEAEDAALLVMSELVSNAITHAGRGSIRVIVTRQAEHVVRLAVVDFSRELPRRREAAGDAEDGRGLSIVAALTDNKWGAEPLPWGKRVWADLMVAKERTDA
ncbi:ATP-binding protein [Streptomyces sp. NPDC046374]|uniref:ATP-binding protein n=1 Tax=Streptomyces sp. NPDC046374 TaxID=3154917 RepID=UPI0033D04F20